MDFPGRSQDPDPDFGNNRREKRRQRREVLLKSGVRVEELGDVYIQIYIYRDTYIEGLWGVLLWSQCWGLQDGMLRKKAESNFSRELGAVVSDWG